MARESTEAAPRIGELVAAARAKAGLSQEALARRLACSAGTVANWERGVSEPRASDLVGIKDACGVPWTFFFADEPNGTVT